MQNRFKAEIEEFRKKVDRTGIELIGITDMDGITRYASPDHKYIAGWEPEELVGNTNLDKIHPDDLQRFIKEFREILITGSTRSVKYRYKHKDGSWINSRSYGCLLKKDGVPHGIVIVSNPNEECDLCSMFSQSDVELVIQMFKLDKKVSLVT